MPYDNENPPGIPNPYLTWAEPAVPAVAIMAEPWQSMPASSPHHELRMEADALREEAAMEDRRGQKVLTSVEIEHSKFIAARLRKRAWSLDEQADLLRVRRGGARALSARRAEWI